MPSDFADDVANFADAGCSAIEVWLTKLEQHLTTASLADTRKLLNDRGVTPAAGSYQGGLLLSQGEERKTHFAHFRKRLELCQQLGIKTLIVDADPGMGIGESNRAALATAMERAVVSLAEVAQWAAGFDVTIALEFRVGSFCACLETALALIHQCGEPNVGVNLDVFHYYTGPSKFEDLGFLTPDRLAHVQLSDISGIPRELARDSDRVLPGDGDFQFTPLLEAVRRLGYQGYVSVEVLNPTLWRANPKQVVEIAYTSLRKTLGLPAASSAWSAHRV